MILAIALGIIAGTITGLIPGIHINLVSSALISIPLGFKNIPVFIVAMAVTHTFVDPIPSIYLGAPDDDTALAVLPGHQLLMCGMGHEAVRLTVVGSLLGLLLSVVLFPLFILAFPFVYSSVKEYMGWVLLAIVIFMILKENKPNKIFWNFIVFLFSGILGMIALNSTARQPLFPMLSGLFGVSMLIHSVFHDVKLPKQAVTNYIKIKNKDTAKAAAAGLFSGSITALLPGIGASHAAIIASSLFRNISSFAYLIIIGGVNTVNFLLSIATLYTLGKARNGAVIAVMSILGRIGSADAAVFLGVALASGGIAAVIALNASKVFAKFIGKIRYRLLCAGVIALIVMLSAVLSGFTGLLILIVSASIGLLPILTGAGRNNSMGCLLLPVMLYLL